MKILVYKIHIEFLHVTKGTIRSIDRAGIVIEEPWTLVHELADLIAKLKKRNEVTLSISAKAI